VRTRGEFSEKRPGAPSPMLALRVRLSQWAREGSIEFLIDTGSARTVIHPEDGVTLGIRFDDLMPAPHTRSEGIGEIGVYAEEPCTLVFDDQDGRAFALEHRLWIALPDPYNIRLPSLLGRDVLQYFA
jgi:hypothetical protein